MPYTQTDIDNLKEGLATGAESIMVEGRMVKFRSVAEIERILARANEEVGAGTGRRKPKRYLPSCGKGV